MTQSMNTSHSTAYPVVLAAPQKMALLEASSGIQQDVEASASAAIRRLTDASNCTEAASHLLWDSAAAQTYRGQNEALFSALCCCLEQAQRLAQSLKG